MRGSLLLVSEGPHSVWSQLLREAVSEQAVVDVATEEEAATALIRAWYDLILIDAGSVRDVTALVYRLRAQRAQVRIVVVTASPTWRRAREALQAGAVDYFRKSLDRVELRARVESALSLVPPPWPR